ncbi:Aromatic ring-opening dioxygenase, catalytic subunit, LigB family [Modicisalibacter ilicicola DSM 19980]|uniref:Aromatic ring-opening dioxygenase, catalytic subunit, LigB family n=1 Tax=Modicisalibacter ilicicola DSM 19980 TaxID=1121942 RepID=A0A1M4W8S9_9GAMM|nr:class III extradiol ring-cleavage dioxygenase [Halomonas ilicicola]SHE77392.1 Aromatic ring-opening dioxygenase, catalytic subunit, LigB family [Halomonas ilicicola DSM 19980]
MPPLTLALPTVLPTLFIPHGAGPCFFMAWNPPEAWKAMADFLQGVQATLPCQPKAILLVSAHWLAPTFNVTSSAHPALIYDYYGFPDHTYQLRYDAPGDPALASRIGELLGHAGIANHQDGQRGFDHGMFIPLKLMFPAAEIPVVQLSLRRDLDPEGHLQAGRALMSLREEGVLIVGSGMSFHNMQGYGDPRFAPISDEFDTWLGDTVSAEPVRRDTALGNWAQAPAAHLCHPPGAEEHLLPLLVAAGAAGSSRGRRIFSDRVMETTLSAFRFP